MPDSLGFNHEVHHGRIYHRCIECDVIPFGIMLTQAQRERHARKHELERKRQLEKDRKANLRLARRAQRTYKEGA